VDLGQAAVDELSIPAPDELDVAVGLVVAAADEGHLGQTGIVPVDQEAGPVVVDRQQDQVAVTNDAENIWLERL
jgi:hypothetical protein